MTTSSAFDILPYEIMQIILLQHCREYLPALREVCCAWRNIVTDTTRRIHLRGTDDDNGIIPVYLLALRGHTDLLQYIHESSLHTATTGWSFHRSLLIMKKAAQGGHTDLLRLCWSWHQQDQVPAPLYNLHRRRLHCTEQEFVAAAAAKGGHESTLHFCKNQLGVRDFNDAMANAALHGHKSIVRLCLQWGADEIDVAMEHAARGGHEHIIRLCLECGADAGDVETAITSAAFYGHESIVRLCLDSGADNVNSVMENAAYGGHLSIVLLCKQSGATDFNAAMVAASQGGHDHIVNLCREWGGHILYCE